MTSAADVLDQKLLFQSIDEQRLLNLREEHRQAPSDPNCSFELAMGLCRSSRPAERNEAKTLFRHLLNPLHHGRYSTSASVFLSQLLYQDGQLDEARTTIEDLYRSNPDNPQIVQLHKAIVQRHKEKLDEEKRRNEDVAMGVGIGGAVLIAGAVLLGGLFRKR